MGNTQGQDTCFVGRPSTKRAVSLISYSLTFPFFLGYKVFLNRYFRDLGNTDMIIFIITIIDIIIIINNR